MLKKFCQSIGLASLVFVMNYGDLLGGGDNVRMHAPFSLRVIVFAQIADIFIVGLFIFIVLAALQRTRFYAPAKLFIAIVVPPYLVSRTQVFPPFILPNGLLPALSALWATLILVLWAKSPHWYRRLLRAGDAAGIIAAAFAMLTIVQLLWVAHWKPGPQQLTAAWSTSPQPPRNHPRLVWIVFDEFSHDQLFDHRVAGLQLPNFDALRQQSTLFTDTQPAGYKTVDVIPSLFTGQPVDDFRFRNDNTFFVHYTTQHGWHKLTGAPTIFHDAQQNGWRTAITGWYNPYCSIYGDALDQCYWMNLDSAGGFMAQRQGFLRNTYAPLQQVVHGLATASPVGRDNCDYETRQHRNTYIDLQDHAQQLLKTDQTDFIFLHLSVPHSPNIWNRATGRFTDTCGRSYLDSLALTDQSLGNILQILQASPRWKDTTLIIEGDHGWRIKLWNHMPSWTPEDEAASRGVFDPRPALLIHQPGQTEPQTNSTPWPLIRLHDIAEQVVTGKPVH